MRNILTIFKRDLHGLFTNFFALVVAVGLLLLPALYAWFNIYANWDPYGNTGNLQIAVANMDEGWVNDEGEFINMGEDLEEELAQKDSIGWVFLDSKEAAIDGVNQGKYYASLVVESDFTYSMYHGVMENIENPHITYYVNGKKNAIATKITDTAVGTVQQSINKQFIKAVTEQVFEEANVAADELEDEDVVASFIEKLDAVNDDLGRYEVMIDDFVKGNEHVSNLAKDANQSLSGSQAKVNDSNAKIADAQKNLAANKADFERYSKEINSSMTNMGNHLDQIGKIIGKYDVDQNAKELAEASLVVQKDCDAMIQDLKDIQKERAESVVYPDGNGGVEQTKEDIEKTKQEKIDAINEKLEQAKKDIEASESAELVEQKKNELDEQAKKDMEQVENDATEQMKRLQIDSATDTLIEGTIKTLEEISEEIGKVTPDSAETAADLAMKQVQNSVDSYKQTLKQLQDLYNNQLVPQINTMLGGMQDAIAATGDILTSLSKTMTSATRILTGLNNTVDATNMTMLELQTVISKTHEQLTEVLDELHGANVEQQTQIIINLLSGNPETLGEFFSEPVKVSENYIYEIKNYGSGVAPFYTTLAIWVGMTILVSLLKVHAPKAGLVDPKPWELFFGRYLLFFFMSQLQALIIVLGNIFIFKIQCLYPLEFWIAAAMASMTFSLLVYSLTIAFGDIGKALAVVIMVIQIAGSGGTYPIEALPSFFRAVYIFFPFPYAIDAMRECIGGMYQNKYSLCLLQLGLFCVAALVIGLVIRVPFIGVNHFIEERMEDTEML